MQGDGSSRNNDKAIINVSFGSLCLLLLSAAIVVHALSIITTIRQKKTWCAFLRLLMAPSVLLFCPDLLDLLQAQRHMGMPVRTSTMNALPVGF